MALFPLPVKAEISDRLRMPARVLQFGDGYEQAALAGLNRQQTTWDVEVIISNSVDDITLNTFLKSVGQHKSFTWQSPRDTVPQLYRITGDVSSTRRNGGGSKPVFFSRRMQFKSTAIEIVTGLDPLYPDVVLLLQMKTLNPFFEATGKVVANNGVIQAPLITDPFGLQGGALSFPLNSSHLAIALSNDFAFASSAFAIDGWLYPTTVQSANWGLMDTRIAPNTAADWSIAGSPTNQLAKYDTSTPFFEFRQPPLTIGQWNYFCFSRPAQSNVTTKLWINGILTGSNLTRNNTITASSDLLIGASTDVLLPGTPHFIGYMCGLRITKAFRDGAVVPSTRFPNS